MKTYHILTVLTVTLFLAASPLSLPADDAAAPRASVEGMRALMARVYEAMGHNDSDTALRLLRQEIAQGRELLAMVAGTPAEAPVKAGLPILERTEAALAAKDIAQAKSLLETLNSMGPVLDKSMNAALAELSASTLTTPTKTAKLDADAVLGKIELEVALKQYEKVLTAEAEADLQCRLGPAESGLTEKQEQQWYDKQQKKRDILAAMADILRGHIRARIEEGNKAARAKEEAKANDAEKAKAATSAPKQ